MRAPRNRTITLTAAAISCAVALSACGGSSTGSTGSGSASKSNFVAGVKYSQCMRSHGVSNFPDPRAGGGIQIQIGSGVNPQSPAFQSAQRACGHLMPGPGGPLHGHGSETRKLALLKLARCMRAHGVSAFPDPVSTPPAPGPGFGLAFGSPGAFLAVPQAIMQSPAFDQAAAACGLPGIGHHGGPKPAATG